MDVKDKVVIVTGGGSGIGSALARRMAVAGASVVVADLNGKGAQQTASAISDTLPGKAIAFAGDVSDCDVIGQLVKRAESHFGPVDIYCANAGVPAPGMVDATEEQWAQAIDVNVMAHIRAARLLIPIWLEHGSGYFVATASAAGVLSQIGSAPYSVTKHAAVGFAEWLSITYGDRGIGVSCLCPMGVNTAMLNAGLADGPEVEGRKGARVVAAAGDVLEPDDVADCVLRAIDEERFLILPHPEVHEFMTRKASDHDRWIRGMRRLQARVQ
jgi:NAD(P)-dependent dehydrogenase (short-subunit alcohol dehydrogenase family)